MAPAKIEGLEFGDKLPAAWLFALWDRRWVRVVLVSVAALVIASGVWFQAVVRPTLTATKLTVSVEGLEADLVIGVDEEARIVTVSGGRGGLSEFIVSGDSLLVLASEVGASSEAEWVEVPFIVLDESAGALAPSRALLAFSRGVKECRGPSSDAIVLLAVLLGAHGGSNGDVSLCGSGWGQVDDQHLIVRQRSVRPSELIVPPDSSVIALAGVSDPESVVTVLNDLLTT